MTEVLRSLPEGNPEQDPYKTAFENVPSRAIRGAACGFSTSPFGGSGSAPARLNYYLSLSLYLSLSTPRRYDEPAQASSEDASDTRR